MDSYTLLVTAQLASLILAVGMWALLRASPGEPGVFDWMLAGLLASTSCLLGILAGKLGTSTSLPWWIMPALGNACYLASQAAVMVGLRRHLRLRAPRRWILLTGVLAYVLHALPWMHGAVGPRLLTIYALQSLLLLAGAHALWRSRSPAMWPVYRPMIVLHLLFVGQLLVRAALLLLQPDMNLSLIGNHAWLSSGYLATTAFTVLLTIFCALLVIRRQALALHEVAVTDSLTGWKNRRALQERAGLGFSKARAAGQRLHVMLLDIDHFKAVNDRHGHATGDDAIRHVTRQIEHAMPGHPDLYRIGGEEFAVLLADLPHEQALAEAQRIRQMVQARELRTATVPLRLTVSIGLATQHGADASWEALLQRADQALYEAKRLGRDRVCLAPG